MLKLSERRRRRQADKLDATFRQLVERMRAFGETAGRFAALQRRPRQVHTAAQVDAMAQATILDAEASISVPLAGLHTAGITVDAALDETALRLAYVDDFRTRLGPGRDGAAIKRPRRGRSLWRLSRQRAGARLPARPALQQCQDR